MEFNKHEQENTELHNIENNKIDIKNSLLKIKVKDILKFLVVLLIIFIVYKGYQFQMSKPVYDVEGITFGLSLYKAVAFPAIMYLILSSRLYKKLKEKFPELNNVKMFFVSLVIVIIVNSILELKLYGSIGGLVGLLIIYIPVGIVVSIISIISYLRKRELKKYLENDFYIETEYNCENHEISKIEIVSTKCNKCSYENKESAKFCNQCGSKIEENQNKVNNKFEADKLSKKKKILLSVLSIIILIVCIMIWNSYKDYQYETGYNLSYQDKKINLEVELITGNYDKAKKLSYAYKIHTDDIDKIIQIYKERKDGKNNFASLSDVENYLSKQNCIITDLYSTSISSSYREVHIIVKNDSKRDINYVKVNLYFYDTDGKIIKSDWTSDSSCIKPGATQQIDKMVNKGWNTFKAELAEYN